VLDGYLAQRHLEGDSRAFGVLVDRYQTRLLNYVHRIIRDRERAEDVVQEVFIRVFRHLHRFDQTRKFSTWVYTIATNLAKSELRDRSRAVVVFEGPVECADARTRPDELFRKRELIDRVSQCVRGLPESLRSVFVLRELEGKSYPEIAAITGCNLGTVKSRLNRARSRFSRMIQPLLE
jgi:RNA polymerase sigma-70 factor (ECF subfamily)